MTPDELREFQQMKQTIKNLQEFVDNLSRFERIPLPVSQALNRKLGIRDVPRIAASAKAASSENQAVNEAGASTYNVLTPPNGWVQLTDAQGNTYVIPYYT